MGSGSYVLAPIRSESSQPIEEEQIVARQRGRWRGFGAAGSGWRKAWHGYFPKAATVDLVPQRTPTVGKDGPGDRLEKNAVLVLYLVGRSYKDAPGSIGHVGFDACGNQPHNLFLKKLPVSGVIFVPDHQVHRQSF